VIKLARPANFSALDPLASQHGFALDRGVRRVELATNKSRTVGSLK
jgi:hypothetical protein